MRTVNYEVGGRWRRRWLGTEVWRENGEFKYVRSGNWQFDKLWRLNRELCLSDGNRLASEPELIVFQLAFVFCCFLRCLSFRFSNQSAGNRVARTHVVRKVNLDVAMLGRINFNFNRAAQI